MKVSTRTSTQTVNPASLLTSVRKSFLKPVSVIRFLMIMLMLACMSANAQTPLISAVNGGFEAAAPTGTPATDFTANGWTVVNGASNQFFVGNAPTASAGSFCAFTGTTATSWVGQAALTISHIYRDITIPAGEGNLVLTFKYKVSAVDATFDFLKAYIAPTSVTPSSGVAVTQGQVGLIAGYDGTTGYVTYTLYGSATPGSTVRLILSYRSDGVTPHGAAAIDEIDLTSYATPQTPGFTATALGGLWSSPATWVGGVVPGVGTDVTIPAGSIVSIDQITNCRNLTVAGTLQWAGSTFVLSVIGDLTINSGGTYLQHTTGNTGQTLNLGGNFTNNGYANLALGTTALNLNGSQVSGGSSNQVIGGSGTFLGNAAGGIIRSFNLQSLGGATITTSQNLITGSFVQTAGALNTNGKLIIDNTAQVYGQPINLRVSNVAVTNMGSLYTVAPEVFGAAFAPYPATGGALAINSRYFSGSNVYLCTVAGTSNGVAPVTTGPGTFTTSGGTLLWIGTTGTLGNPFPVTAVTLGTQYFYGGNLYVCTVVGTPAATAPPIHTSGTASSGTATFLYVGTPASVTVNYDATTQTLRSLNLVNPGSGYVSAPSIAFSVGVAGGTGSGAAAAVSYIQLIAGPANSLTQKSGGAATITGGININSDQGVSVATANPQGSSGVGAVSTSNGGLNYTVAPVVGFSGPQAINLVVNGGAGYTTAPTITVDATNLVTGTNLTTANFTITMNQGRIVSVYLNTGTTATYSAAPTLTLSSALGGASVAFPAGSWPAATAIIGSNRQLTNFNVTNPGFGYIAAPTVGIGTTSGTTNGGTFTTVATAPTARIALYNLTLNFFSPATSAIVSSDDAAIPVSRKMNNLSLNGNGNGLNLTSNLTLFGTAPLALVASASNPGNILDLGGNNLNFTWNGYAGATSTFGATNTYIKNGSMSLLGRGGGSTGSTFNFPFSGTFTWFSGSTPTVVTTGASATNITVTETVAPTGAGSPIGTRSFRVQTNPGSTYGLNPTIAMNYNSQDALLSTNSAPGLFIAQSAATTGPWVLRSASSGSGSFGTTGTRTTATTGNGPIVPTGDDYFAWTYPAPAFANVTVPTGVCPASPHTITADITTPSGTLSTVVLNYNNGASGSVSMTLVSGDTYTGTIPAATTPTNAVVTWNITATSSIGVPAVFTGTTYQDEYLNNLSLPVTATPQAICEGSSSVLNGILSIPPAPSYTAPPAVTNPPFNLDLGNITITQGATTILNNTTAENSLVGSIGTATGTAGSFSNFTAFGPYAVNAGQSYDFSISNIVNPPGFTNAMAIFIDYNRNGVFTDAGETVYTTPSLSSTVSHAETGSFLVPANALNGLTRMRIVTNLQSLVTGPTMTVSWGEYEEYTLNILNTGVISYAWSDGTSTVGTTVPLTVTPAATTTYTLTASNPAGCTVVSAPITVSVSPIPPAPVTAPSTQCGVGVPLAFAVGGLDGNYRWYLAPTGGTALPGEVNGALGAYSISTTTTFYVAINNGACDGPRTSVVATVTQPDPVTAFVDGLASTTSCTNTALALTAVQTGSSNTYTFTWTASPSAGSGIPTNLVGANQTISPTAAGSYTYTVTAFDANGSCTAVSSVTATVNPQPVVSSTTATPSTVCAGDPVILSATSIGGAGTGTIGTGSVSNTNGPYKGFFGGHKVQMLYTAAELTALGMAAGSGINSVGFDITAFLSPYTFGTVEGFTIAMKNTSTTVLTTTLETGTTTVFSPGTFTLSGTAPFSVSHTLTTPFTWNGTSNLLVEFCFNNNNGGGSSTNSANVRSSTTATNLTAYYTSDNLATVCSAPGAATVSTVRPNITLNYSLDLTNTLNWVWNPGAVPGSTVTVNPTATTLYTVTATIPATGCTQTGTVNVNVNPLPDAPGVNTSEQCGVGVPAASVTSNTASPVFHWYLVPTGGTFLPGELGATLTAYSISSTTTFYVSEVSTFGCESPRTAVLATVLVPDPVTAFANAVSGSTATCLNASINLTVTSTGGNNTYDYNWTASPAAGSGIPSGQVNGDNINVLPTAPGTYTYTVVGFDADKGCTNSSSVTVTVNPLPAITSVTATPGTVCSGSAVSLSALSIGGVGNGTIGTGSVSNTNGPYKGFFGGHKVQMLYTAAELTALGMAAGSGINSVGFDITAFLSPYTFGTVEGFTIAMKNTSTTVLTTTLETGTTTVFSPGTFTLSGTAPFSVSHTLTTPFTWNGTSNLLVEFCFNNNNGGGSSTNSANVRSSTTATNLTAYYTSDNLATVCSAPGSATVSTTRPNITLNYSLNLTGTLNWVWNPGALTGSTVTVNPLTTTAYTVTATNPLTGCSNSAAPITVNVNPLPATPTATPSTQCGLGTPTASVSGAGGTFRWYDAPTGGNLLQTGGSSYTSPINITTTFYVAEYDGLCESERVAVVATVNQPDPVVASVDDNSICPSNTIQLTATQTSTTNGNVYTYTWTASPAAGSGIPTSVTGAVVSVTPTVAGTYVYTVTAFDPNGPCTTTSTVSVTVNPNPAITSAIATQPVICAGSSTTLVGQSVNAIAGTTTVGTQTTTIGGNDGNPYRSGNGAGNEIRTQLLVTAADLTAAGLTTGNITSLAFTTTGIGGTVNNFTIKMGNTVASSLTTTFETSSMTTVFTQAAFTTVLGINTHTFSTPFNWDGTSNIIIDICQTNAAQGTNTVAAFTPSYASNTHRATTTTSCTAVTGVAVTNRPIMTFGGQVGTDVTGNYNWVWNPGALAGSTVTVSPVITTSYTATVTEAATGCFSVSAPVTVTVAPVTAAASATPNVSCAGAPVVLNATPGGGGPFTYSWNDGVSNFSLVQSPTVNPTATTTYTVTVRDACNNPATATVTVTVNPLPTAAIAEPGPITICEPATQVLTAVTNAASPTYQWFLNGIAISGATSPSYTVSAIGTGSYTVRVTETSTTCVSNASAAVVVTINPQPQAIVITPANPVICFGSSVVLNATSGAVGSITVGTGTVSNTNGPYKGFFGGHKTQMLYTAAELSGLGLVAGTPISTLSMNITAFSSPFTFGTVTGFSIGMKNSSSTVLTSVPETGLTTVFSPGAYTLSGSAPFTVSHTLTTPFTWDGTSSIIVEFCFNNNDGGGASANSANVRSSTTTGFIRTAYFTADSNPNVCTTATGWTTTTTRPNMTFGYSNVSPITLWSPSTGLNTTTGGTVTASPTSTTTYTVTATTAFGCPRTNTVTVNVTELPVLTINPVTSPVCLDAAAQTLSATPAGGTFSGPGVSGNTFTPSAAGAGTHTITYSYTDPSTTCSNTATTTILVNPLPVAPIISIVNNTNGTSTITATNYTGTLNWSNGGSDNPHIVNAAGPYWVTQTDLNGCTSPISNIVTAGPSITADPAVGQMDITNMSDVSQNANILAHAQVYKLYLPVYNFEQDFAIPNGATTLTLDLGTKMVLDPAFNLATAPLSAYFSWSHAVVAGHDIITGSQIAAIPGDFDGMAIFQVIGSGSCTSSFKANFVIDNHASVIALNDLVPNNNFASLQYNLPVTVSATSTNVLCNGAANGTITVNASPGTTVTVNGNPYNPLANYPPGTYTIVATALGDTPPGNTCSATTSVTITEPTVLTVGIFAQTDVTGCFGNTNGAAAAAAAGGTAPYTYSWNTTPAQNTAIAVGLGAGTYTVTATDANGCTATATVTITQPTQVIATISAQTNVDCNGNNSGTATVSASGGTPGYSYSWNTVPVQTGTTATGLIAGTYTVTVTDNNFCTGSTTVTITEPDVLGATATVINVSCFGAADGSATANVTGGTMNYSYSWNTVPVQTDVTASNLTPGTYTLTVTDANGCIATHTFTVSEPIEVTISATATNVTCNGAADGTITATASAGASITVDGNPYNPLATYGPGTYTVVASAPNGNANGFCTATTTVTITEPIPVTVSATNTNVTCNGAANGTITVTGLSAGATYIIQLNGAGPDLSAQTLFAPGVYVITASAPNGNNDGVCTQTATVTVTEPAVLVSVPTGTAVTCNGLNNGTADANVSGGTAPYGYSWNTTPVQTTAIATGLAPGTYTVTVTDANGCTTTGTYTVTEPAVLTVSAVTAPSSCNGGSNGTVTATAAGGTTAYAYTIAGPVVNTTGATSGIFTGLTAGSYTVSVTDANGCTATSAPVTVTQPTGTAPNISLGSDYTDNFFGSNGATNTIVYNVAEIGGNPATGDTIRITRVAGYTISFNNSLTSIIVQGTPYTLDNARWKIDNSNAAFVSIIFDPLQNNTPGTLSCQEKVNVSINMTRNTPNLSTFTLSARLRRANGEVNLTNNLNSIVFIAE